jgi:transcriptional regulator with PAS, ATPase and Fis domain
VNLRVLAATNRDLAERVHNGEFRQDLYYRLNVVTITTPPLRERPQDIPLLANYFVQKFARRAAREVLGLSQEAQTLLQCYAWPGNVRELENAIERAIVLGSTALILPEDLPEALVETQPVAGVLPARYHEAVNEAKKQVVLQALEQAGGNFTEAAKLLGLHANNLHRLIRNLDLRQALRKGGTERAGASGK